MAALGPFERAPRLAVAVSGGPDSLALTLLAARWAGQVGGTVQGLTVDHGLRPESAAEAEQVVAWLGTHGIACRVLTWTGPKPATGVQAAARSARYALLAAACREAGILHLLLAHHELDQAETACMRAERGSGLLGLAGMAAVSERAGLRLLRPLLRSAPERLKATLVAVAQPWLDDPGNVAQRFRRARLRSRKRLRSYEAGSPPRLPPQRYARRQTTPSPAFAAAAVTPSPLGYLTLALGPWRELPDEVAELVLARCILAVSGQPYAAAGREHREAGPEAAARPTGTRRQPWRDPAPATEAPPPRRPRARPHP